ncbi:MAG: hypothetical protein GDA51_11380 [Ekhidna sp.]|nr:hypothetical protein [Ekhidna sp.]
MDKSAYCLFVAPNINEVFLPQRTQRLSQRRYEKRLSLETFGKFETFQK